ncbi:MAG TPA: glycosyltransferase family A protein [Longimicrobiaceae bacterium]|nr:glycosyltransferase family A protein [Longimicrobiaceae bacterium]
MSGPADLADPGDRTDGPSPLVSIVIPSYVSTPKQAELLDETLHTVAAQTCRDYEIIVVDDGSPLDVGAVTASHAATVTVRQANGGSAVARNTGIRLSRGRYFVFLDADDHLLPPALEAGLRAFDEHPECGFVVGRREEMTYEGGPVPWGVASLPRETWLYNILLGFDWYIIPPSSAMFRREAVEAVGGFRDPWGADDLDFYLRIAREYPGWCYEEPAVTRYRRYAASSSRDGERMLRSIRAVYARQWPLVQGDPDGEAAFHRGLTLLTNIFIDCLAENFVDGVRARNWRRVLRTGSLLAREKGVRAAATAARVVRPSASSGGHSAGCSG